jgi:hypothetical protein
MPNSNLMENYYSEGGGGLHFFTEQVSHLADYRIWETLSYSLCTGNTKPNPSVQFNATVLTAAERKRNSENAQRITSHCLHSRMGASLIDKLTCFVNRLGRASEQSRTYSPVVDEAY